MCFHTKQTKSLKELEQRFKAKVVSSDQIVTSDAINGFSFPKTPVITDKQSNLIQPFNWGLIPFWAKSKDIRQYTLNAKVETLKEKPSFKNSINQRCLVIVDGFYEWKWLDPKGKKKQKYLLELKNHDSFTLGGIWSEWVDKSTGEILNTYSIVTTAAKGIMAEIHNSKKRMPIILSPQKESNWLNHDDFSEFLELEIDLTANKL